MARVILLGEWGFPFTEKDFCTLIKFYLDRKRVVSGSFKDNLTTLSFVYKFLKRHPTLTLRKANPLKRSRAKDSREEVKDFITRFEKTCEGVPAVNIFNFDETNLQDDLGSQLCLFKKGVKYAKKVQNTSKQAILVIFCGSAGGQMVPPMVVYKAGNIYPGWTKRGPKGTTYSHTKSGWFDMAEFEKWFFSNLVPILRRKVVKLLL